MLWRHLCLVRAWSAAGLLTSSLLGAAFTAPAWAEPAEPAPKANAAASETVSILDARKAGELAVELRGAGQDRVKMTLKNTSGKRLKVVLPPGLVASSATGQGRGGFQNMGLGSVSNRPGAFGAFKSSEAGQTGFRSVAVKPGDQVEAVAVPAGESIDLAITSVCLNFGVRTPNAHDRFELVDVDDYTTDLRARKALRSLATFGTSQGVAQAAMWRVCNDVPFALMAEQATKVMNRHEVALAARFVEAVDASNASDLVDPAYLTEGRLFVKIAADGLHAKDAERLAREIEGKRVLGLPVRVLASNDSQIVAPAVLANVVLTSSQAGETKGRIVLSQVDDSGRWAHFGKTYFTVGSAASALDGAGLALTVDRAVSSACVSVKIVRKSSNATTVKVENRLPFTLAKVTLRAGASAGAPTASFAGLGIAPARSAQVAIEAPGASVEHVEINGL
jgi:hypothetical protein